MFHCKIIVGNKFSKIICPFGKIQDIVKNMTARGHNVTGGEYAGGAVICGITVEADGFIYANSDWRKSGDVDGLDPVN